MTGLSQKVCYDFRRQISEKINRLPLAYFEKRTVGEVLSRNTNDVDTLGQSLNQSVTQLITSITTMIVLIMMLSISPKMTLIALLILPVSLVLVMLVVRFSQKYFKAQQATLGVVNGQVEEVYSGHNVIKAFTVEAGRRVVGLYRPPTDVTTLVRLIPYRRNEDRTFRSVRSVRVSDGPVLR